MWIAFGVVSAVVALFAATTYLVLRVLIEYDIRAAYFIFASWCEVIANLAVMLSWTIAHIAKVVAKLVDFARGVKKILAVAFEVPGFFRFMRGSWPSLNPRNERFSLARLFARADPLYAAPFDSDTKESTSMASRVRLAKRSPPTSFFISDFMRWTITTVGWALSGANERQQR